MTDHRRRLRLRNRRTMAENWDRARDVHRSAVAAGFEALAGVADTARTFLREMAENEPFSQNTRWGGVVRDLPDSLAAAKSSVLDEAIEIPHRVVDRFYEEYEGRSGEGDVVDEEEDYGPARRSRFRGGDRGSRRARKGGGYRREAVSRSEQRIIDLVETRLSRVPASGATLSSVVDHVVLATDYDPSIVKSVIRRHFVVEGPVVSKQRVVTVETRSMDAVVDWMEDTLRDRGYQDLREDYDLTGLPDLDETADLVAFDGEDPLVLCYAVDEGDAEASSYHEAAKFQAGAIAPGKVARIAWVSDGKASYIFDMERDRVLARLPRREELRSSPGAAISPGGAADRERHGKTKGGSESAT